MWMGSTGPVYGKVAAVLKNYNKYYESTKGEDVIS
jgi:hypothetical protein